MGISCWNLLLFPVAFSSRVVAAGRRCLETGVLGSSARAESGNQRCLFHSTLCNALGGPLDSNLHIYIYIYIYIVIYIFVFCFDFYFYEYIFVIIISSCSFSLLCFVADRFNSIFLPFSFHFRSIFISFSFHFHFVFILLLFYVSVFLSIFVSSLFLSWF